MDVMEKGFEGSARSGGPPGNLEIGPEKENAGNAKTC
jgi:hypothetical protein